MRLRCNSCGVFVFLSLSSVAWADFSDIIPSSFGETLYRPRGTPTPTPTPSTITTPSTSTSTSAPATMPVVPAAPAPIAPNAIPAPVPSGGSTASDKVFGDVKHDTSAPVSIVHSDEFRGSRDKGVFVLNGKVSVAQETLTLNASKISMFTEQGLTKPNRILSEKDCHLLKMVKPDGSDKIQAWSQDMEYNLTTGKVRFIKDARVVRGKDCNLQGDILEYDMNDGTVSGRAIRGSCAAIGAAAPKTK